MPGTFGALGSLRFFLACLVVQSHISGAGHTLNLGMTAVVVFYFISGYLMNLSYRRFDSPLSFYGDRLARLYPAYVFLLIVTMGARYLAGNMPGGFDAPHLLANLAILPVNYFADNNYAINGVTWSLAAEMHFYLMVPLIFALRRWVLAALTITLCLLHIASFFVSGSMTDLGFQSGGAGIWNDASTWLSYRWPFLIFTVFLMGFLAADKDGDSKVGLAITYGLYACFFFVFFYTPFSQNTAVREVALGVAVAVPLTLAILRVRFERAVLLDRLLGQLSYPLFLSHMAGIYLAQAAVKHFAWHGLAIVFLGWGLSLLLAYCAWWIIEQNMRDWRYRLRGFGKAQPTI